MDPAQRSMVMVRIGGIDYPAVTSSRCRVCQSPHRVFIENELIRGRSMVGIHRDLDGMEHGGRPMPSVQSIKNHSSNHLPVGAAVQRRIIDRRAKEVGKSIEDSEEPLVDYLTLNEMVVQRAFDRLQSGEIKVSVPDALAASKFLREVERQSVGDELNNQIWSDAFVAYMDIVLKYIPADRRNEFAAELHSSPVLKALSERQKQLQQQESGL